MMMGERCHRDQDASKLLKTELAQEPEETDITLSVSHKILMWSQND